MYGGTITWAGLCNICHTLWGDILYIVYGVVYHTYSIEWYTVHTLWNGIPYILCGVVYRTYSME